MQKLFKVSAVIFLLMGPFFLIWMTLGVSSETWEQKGYLQFSKGTLDKVSITGDGYIILSPLFGKIAEVPEKVIWMLAEDTHGGIYAATGNEGRIYKISKDGKVDLFFDAEEVEIHSIVFDRHDVLYAATSPDGKVYKIEKSGKSSELCELEDKYIWAMTFGQDGTLYIATGEKGQIYEISRDGKAQLFYEGNVDHIRTLISSGNGHLIAGTAGEGLIMRIDPDGTAFVLFDSSRQEISSLALSKEGTIYAAAVGKKTAGETGERKEISGFHIDVVKAMQKMEESHSETDKEADMSIPEKGREEPIAIAGSEIIKIEKSGFPEQIWESQNEIVHSLLLDDDGNLLIGTGNDGIIYRIDKDKKVSVLVKTDDHQITCMIPSHGRILVGSGSNSTLSFIGKDLSAGGEYLSQVKDTNNFSTWGVFKSEFDVPPGTKVSFYTRSGNKREPDETWSSWKELTMKNSSSPVDSPRARFIQWKGKLERQERVKESPVLKSSIIHYLPENLAPKIKTIEIQEPGIFYQKLPLPQTIDTQLSGTSNRSKTKAEKSISPIKMRPPIKKAYRYGKRTVSWEASDPNGDQLKFSVDFKGMEEKAWKTLEKELTGNFYSWDSRLMADGIYAIRIVASDSPSNPERFAKQSEKESEPFIIDNTPPSVTSIEWIRHGDDIDISFSAKDNISNIEHVEYSLNAEEWKLVFPEDKVYDSPEESFHIELSLLEKGEHTLVFKVMDEAGNIGSGKAIITIDKGNAQ